MEHLDSSESGEAGDYEPPRFEVIGSLHDLTQVNAPDPKDGSLPDLEGTTFITATVS